MINPFGGLAETLIARSNAAIEVFENDYEQDGILYCGNCNTRKQVTIPMGTTVVSVMCLCKCKTAERDTQEEEERQRQEVERISRLRSQGIQDKAVQSWTFANDDGRSPVMTAKATKYCARWREMYKENIGLLCWGGVGTGKTYFAACIANTLLDDGVPVLMTNFPKIINALSGFHTEDKNAYIDSFDNYWLLIIDDLGAERQSEFAQEIVFSVIDARYKSGKPTIITTNMTLDDMKNPKTMMCERIYDRIREMCMPVKFEGESRRVSERQAKMETAKALFESQ